MTTPPTDFFTQKKFMEVPDIAKALEIDPNHARKMILSGQFGPHFTINPESLRKVHKVLSLNVLKFLQNDKNFLPLVDPQPLFQITEVTPAQPNP